jgi:hypothetical protein
LVLELAHRDEKVGFSWRAALPEDPLEVLAACGKVRVETLARSQSHLSDSTRPLYLVTVA